MSETTLNDRAAAMECTVAVLEYIEKLEERIADLDEKMEKMTMNVGPIGRDPDTVDYRLKRLEDRS